jgi:uncharacterized protein YkwD
MIKKLIFIGFISFAVTASAADIQKEALSFHNKLRAQHNAPRLIWDESLAQFARTYASQCHFEHSHGKYGENLAAGYPTVSAGINAWYSENKNYSYFFPGFSSKTGHFTQIVWKSSKRLGCAFVECNGMHGTPGKFLVCEYSPAGNVIGRRSFSENVLR